MKNEDVVQLLTTIADMLELKGESGFKIRAYREAARQIENTRDDLTSLSREGRLTEIRGIGKSIADKISEYVETGGSSYRDELRHGLPEGIEEILRIPGIGAKKAQFFFQQLGISSLDQLEEAAKSHKLRELPTVQEKTEERVLEGIRRLRERSSRLLLGLALPAAEEIVELMRKEPSVKRVDLAGSIRRMQETIGDVDILVASSSPAEAIDAFTKLPPVKSVIAKGPTKASVLTRQDLQMDLRVVAPDEWGAALQYFTGSKEHNIALRSIAESKGMKINEYGLFKLASGEKVAGAEEVHIYRELGMQCPPPEMRQANGEIELASQGKLPDLIELADIRGDLHTHTKWSDGVNTIEEMATAAMRMGYEYLVISDHSVSMGFISGLTTDRVQEQRRMIDELNKGYDGFRLLQGIEVNIRSDGTLDYNNEVLASFDVVTASIHGGLNQSKEKITGRMLSAIRNPHVDVIGHPTGRIIGRRQGYDFDRDAVFKAAAENCTAMEIDSQPDRLDLKDSDARMAMDYGVMVAITSDAHNVEQLGLTRYGIGTARRGWVTKDRVLNALSAEELLVRVGR